jgi:hypothetical protein
MGAQRACAEGAWGARHTQPPPALLCIALPVHCRMVNYIELNHTVLHYIAFSPLVMTTVWNFENTGFMARLASRHDSCSTGSGT